MVRSYAPIEEDRSHARRGAGPGSVGPPHGRWRTGSQFTALFERLAIDLLRECSITGAVELLRISWDEGWGIKARAVKRGLARRDAEVVGRLGVDEKAIAKRHRYLTIVADLEQSRVLYLADDRKQESLDGFWPTLTPAQGGG